VSFVFGICVVEKLCKTWYKTVFSQSLGSALTTVDESKSLNTAGRRIACCGLCWRWKENDIWRRRWLGRRRRWRMGRRRMV